MATCLLDCYGCSAAAAQAAAAELAALRITCCADRESAAGAAPTLVDPLLGVAFRVVSAPTEFERRAVDWLYRHNPAPDADDWRACAGRFGLARPPPHVLTGARGAVAVDIDLDRRLCTVTAVQEVPAAAVQEVPAAAVQEVPAATVQEVNWAPSAPPEIRPITVGSLAPRQLLAGKRARKPPAAPV